MIVGRLLAIALTSQWSDATNGRPAAEDAHRRISIRRAILIRLASCGRRRKNGLLG